MSESRGHTNGAERSESGARFPQHLTETGRQIRGDAQNLVTHVSEAGTELQSYVTDMVRERPLATIGVMAGIGYLLGGGLSSRLSVLALGVGTRFAMAVAAREMSSWALQAGGGDQRSRGMLTQGREQGREQGQQNREQGRAKEQGQQGQGKEQNRSGQSGQGGSSQTH
jgi:ElaB/YqjD/DUF883 family membrane-anchored ribosome-binding protein